MKKELNRLATMAPEAITTLSGNNSIEEFGKVLDIAWKDKRKLSKKISTPEIDQIYNEAKKAGAVGGKLLGAGGGGFMLLFVKLEAQRRVSERLIKLIRVPFMFDTLQ